METYANQKIIKIEKEIAKKGFLQINKKDWMNACQTLQQYGSFKLYLYLANNNNSFIIALSQVAVTKAIGISKSTYHRAVDELIYNAYLTKTKNGYVFTTAPNPESEYFL